MDTNQIKSTLSEVKQAYRILKQFGWFMSKDLSYRNSKAPKSCKYGPHLRVLVKSVCFFFEEPFYIHSVKGFVKTMNGWKEDWGKS